MTKNYNSIVISSRRMLSSISSFGSYSLVTPGKVTPPLTVPKHIKVPIHKPILVPQVRSNEGIEKLRESCRTTRHVLDFATQLVKVGITTNELDEAVHELCMKLGVYPSPLFYEGFPKSICTSVNNVVCHGIPDDRKLQDGDIINIDISVYADGYHGDCSRTVLVGNVDKAGKDLVSATEEALLAGINVCRNGCPFSEIGAAVELAAHRRGFNVIPSVAGHGVGEQFHEAPDIFHFAGGPQEGVMKEGMAFTIEPALTQGDTEIEILEDEWTAVTVDGARSAQAEHTILITKDGCQILTQC